MPQALTRATIVEAIYNDNIDVRSRNEAKNIVEDMIALMKKAIKEESALLLSSFGRFEAYGKDARKGRNPQTAETITLPPRKVVVFRLSRKFKAELNGSASMLGTL